MVQVDSEASKPAISDSVPASPKEHDENDEAFPWDFSKSQSVRYLPLGDAAFDTKPNLLSVVCSTA